MVSSNNLIQQFFVDIKVFYVIKMTISEEIVINLENISKIYEETEVVKNLNLKVKKNSIFGFLGPNGAGKTTTMKMLLGLIKSTSGKGTIFGKDMVKDSISIREKVGYLPQEIHMYNHMTAREILHFTAKFYFKGPVHEIEKRVNEMLKLVGLEDKADRPIKTFSGGEKQRLGIAQAEINYPDLLILDEPAASIDPIGRRDVLDVLERLREYSTVFYSTHILDDVERVSDTVAILNHGQLIAQGPIDEILAGHQGNMIVIEIKGNCEPIIIALEKNSWIKEIKFKKKKNLTELLVSVIDPVISEKQLLRQILQFQDIDVIEYKQKQYDLEDIFINLIENGGEQ